MGESDCNSAEKRRKDPCVSGSIQLNKATQREHYQLPTRDEIHAKFKAAHYFSKLDARTEFWQMKLDQNSSKLTCFNTPFGRYRFLRLPFGITSAPEIYHRTIHMIYEHIPGCTTMMNDILEWGSTLQEHNQRLQQVFDASRKSNLKLNREKCVFGVKEHSSVTLYLQKESSQTRPRSRP